MEAMLNFIPAPIAIALMLLGFVALAVGGIRLGISIPSLPARSAGSPLSNFVFFKDGSHTALA